MAERLTKQQQKEMRRQWEAQQKAAARDAFPLPGEQMMELFDYLEREFPIRGCDHTLKLTREWLSRRQIDINTVIDWLHDNGGFCDCEAAGNAKEAFESAIATLPIASQSQPKDLTK